MDVAWFVVAAGGLLVLVASIFAARHPTIPKWEARIFRAVNGLPAWLYWVLWVPMQLGNLVVGTGAGLAVGWWQGELDVAIGVITAMVLKLVTERIVRR